MKKIIPQKLKKGDVIGIISPSGTFNSSLENNLKTGIAILEKYGFKVKIAGVFKDYLKKDFQKEFGVRIVEEIL